MYSMKSIPSVSTYSIANFDGLDSLITDLIECGEKLVAGTKEVR